MRVNSQGLINASERFFHSLYTSAAGDQFLNGDPLRDSPLPALSMDLTTEILLGFAIGLFILFAFFYITRKIVLNRRIDTSLLPVLN